MTSCGNWIHHLISSESWSDWCYRQAKRSLMAWAVVIPKEYGTAPALLLVWHRLFRFFWEFFFFSQAIKDLFAWCRPYMRTWLKWPSHVENIWTRIHPEFREKFKYFFWSYAYAFGIWNFIIKRQQSREIINFGASIHPFFVCLSVCTLLFEFAIVCPSVLMGKCKKMAPRVWHWGKNKYPCISLFLTLSQLNML